MTKEELKLLTELSNALVSMNRDIARAQEKINKIMKIENKTTIEKITEKIKGD